MKHVFDLTVRNVYDYLCSSSSPKDIKEFLDSFKIYYRTVGGQTYEVYGIANITFSNSDKSSKGVKIYYTKNEKMSKKDENVNYYEYIVSYIKENYEKDLMMYDLTF